MFEIGEKVICVNKKRIYNDGGCTKGIDQLIEGKVYTVVGIGYYVINNNKTILLNELKNYNKLTNNIDVGFDQSRFRKLIKKKTDISIFTKMLNTTEKELTTSDN